MFGMFNQANVSVGKKNTEEKTYVYGAANSDWSGIFGEIAQSENMVSSEPVHVKNVVITDTLSDYVELQNTDKAQNYGVTVGGIDEGRYSVKASDKKITVTFDEDYELTDGTTYTVNIPVRSTQKAVDETLAEYNGTKTFETNNSASLSYSYGDNEVKTVDYAEKPEITLHRYFTGHSLTLRGDVGLNFYVRLTQEELEKGAEVRFVRDITGGTTYTTVSSSTVTSADYDEKTTYYIVPCSMNAAEMTCDVHSEIYIGGVLQIETIITA